MTETEKRELQVKKVEAQYGVTADIFLELIATCSDRTRDAMLALSEKRRALKEDTREWRESRLHEGEGNDRFWDHAVTLRTTRMNIPEIEAKLSEEAQFARHPDQRLAQISSIMTNLRKSRRKAG